MPDHQIIRRLAIQTLDYVERKEYTLLYFSNDWNELVELLRRPRKFYSDLQLSFPYDADTEDDAKLSWEFAPGPITAVIRNSLNRPEATAKVFSFASSEKSFESFFADVDGPTLNDAPPEVHDGAFLAEFALSTRTILITYCPPRQERATKNRYKGELSRVNLALGSMPLSVASEAGENVIRDYGSLHFDVQQDELERAKFAVAYLEDPVGICDRLTDSDDQIPIAMSTQTFAEPGQAVRIAIPDSQRVPNTPKISFRVNPTPSKRGTLIMEGLDHRQSSMDQIQPLGPPCTSSIVYRDGDVFTIDTMIIKAYAPR